jgi:hypothetical protein
LRFVIDCDGGSYSIVPRLAWRLVLPRFWVIGRQEFGDSARAGLGDFSLSKSDLKTAFRDLNLFLGDYSQSLRDSKSEKVDF